MFKVNNSRFGVFIVNFEHISRLFSSVSIVDIEKVNVSWAECSFVYFLTA